MLLKGLNNDCLVMDAVTKEGIRRQVRFWAERGLIHCEDSIDNSYKSMSVKSFMLQVKGINDMLGRSAASSDAGADADLRQQTQRYVEKAVRIAEIAKVQGMPTDASARRDMSRRRARTICCSAGNAIM